MTAPGTKVLAFHRPMGTSAPEIPPQPPPALPPGTQIHGNTSQRLSALFAGGALFVSCLSLLGVGLNVYWHYSAESAINADKHINDLIAAQIKPLSDIANDEHINRLIADQIKPLSDNVNKIAEDVAFLKGQLHDVNVKLDRVRGPEASLLAQGSNPEKAMTGIRTNLQQAQDQGKILPDPILSEYRNKVQTLPTSTTGYWTAVAAIINYQSYVNQREKIAPNPLQIAKPCRFVTQGSGGDHNIIQGAILFTECYVDLDGTTNEVDGAVFKNSVIRWHGGPVTIKTATFINCRFIIDIKGKPTRPDLLKQLLASDQTYFALTAAG